MTAKKAATKKAAPKAEGNSLKESLTRVAKDIRADNMKPVTVGQAMLMLADAFQREADKL